MRIFTIIFAVLFLFPAIAGAIEVNPGDFVKLVERDIGIPVHPEAGDDRVSLRFGTNEVDKVLSIDSETGWLLVRSSDEKSGWITARYVSSVVNPNGDWPNNGGQQIDWCPAKRSANPHTSGRLRIASWNMANLHSENGKSVYTGNQPSEIRDTIDYERIKCYVRMFDPDILAVQEVDGEKALKRVVDTDVYNVHVSSRSKPSGLNGKQNTGFAYKKGLTVQEMSDVKTLDVAGDASLRYGTLIRVTHNGRSFKMLSVHLKSGCFDDSFGGSSCTKLFQQVPKLEAWIDTEAAGNEPFIVLGDFNRRLNIKGDDVWEEIDDGQPANADLTTVTENKCISCRDNKYESFIDHMVFGKRAWVEDSSFRQVTYRQADKPVWGQISDHCPVVVDLWIN